MRIIAGNRKEISKNQIIQRKMTEKEKILRKLRKLMNLKESASEIGNEGEAMKGGSND